MESLTYTASLNLIKDPKKTSSGKKLIDCKDKGNGSTIYNRIYIYHTRR